jgi:hypothetical protein
MKGVIQQFDVRRPRIRRKRIQATDIAVDRSVGEKAEYSGILIGLSMRRSFTFGCPMSVSSAIGPDSKRPSIAARTGS